MVFIVLDLLFSDNFKYLIGISVFLEGFYDVINSSFRSSLVEHILVALSYRLFAAPNLVLRLCLDSVLLSIGWCWGAFCRLWSYGVHTVCGLEHREKEIGNFPPLSLCISLYCLNVLEICLDFLFHVDI